MLTGYKTLLFNLLTPFFLYLGSKGIPMDEDTKMQLTLAIMAIGNAILRTVTTCPAPWAKKPVPKRRRRRKPQPPPQQPPVNPEAEDQARWPN